MRKLSCIFLFCLVVKLSAAQEIKEKAKQGIIQTEKDFEKMEADKGLAEAFGYFAGKSAVI